MVVISEEKVDISTKMMHSDVRNRQDAFSIYSGRKLATVLLLIACSCSRIILVGPCKVPFSQLCVGGRQKRNRMRRRHTVGCNSMSIPQKEKIIVQKACPRMDPFRLCIVVYDSYPFFRLIFCHGDERSRVMGHGNIIPTRPQLQFLIRKSKFW